MAGFMKLQAWSEHYADFAPASGGFAETRPLSEQGDDQRVSDVSERKGWFARYSAPGYMDRTDSVGPFDTYQEAIQECLRLYGEEGEGSIASEDELEAIEMLVAYGMPETEASRLILRSEET